MIKPNQIIQGDCLKIMRKFSDKSVDLILTDPPYNCKNIGPKEKVYAEGRMQLPLKEYKKFCKDWFREARRIAKTIIFTPGIMNVCYYPQPIWILCWHKPAAVSFNKFRGYNVWEPILIYGKIAKNKRLGQDYILVNTLNFSKGLESDHPCPKPLKLVEILVDKFSVEGELILDPMAGSCTTAVACKNLKRKFIMIEKIEKYCEIGRQRLRQEILI